jgi:hypothetical protein
MCFKQIAQALGMAPSARKQAAAATAQAEAAKAATPARAADEARDETGAVILETDAGSTVETGTDVAVRRTKKNSRKGVPGLGL